MSYLKELNYALKFTELYKKYSGQSNGITYNRKRRSLYEKFQIASIVASKIIYCCHYNFNTKFEFLCFKCFLQ